MKALYSIGLLILSNVFMTIAWYGHLKSGHSKHLTFWAITTLILISWGIAFFEYCLQVPANRIGYRETGGPFSLMQLKVIQEIISLTVFMVFTVIVFKGETFKWNHIAAFGLIVIAVYLVFKK